MSLLEIRNLKKSFDGKEILKNVSLSIEKGEVVSIIGPSGSGKTTLLRCATLLETMDAGELLYDKSYAAKTINEKIKYVDEHHLKNIQSKFGLVFQNFNLFPHFSVLKNITCALTDVKKMDKKEAEKIGMDLLNKIALTDKKNSYPCQLSGGQKQRVAIARALALNPEILFFDEPTSALDPELTGEILTIIKALASYKMTMVIVTHEISFARDVSDRIIFMENGLICEQGTPDEVINNPKKQRTKIFLSRFNNI